jgi:NTE family protein
VSVLSVHKSAFLRRAADHKVDNIVHLIYGAEHYEGHSKDYGFSRLAMEERSSTSRWRSVRTAS